MIHAHKFTECMQSMIARSDSSGYPIFGDQQKLMAKICKTMVVCLDQSERFFYPLAEGMLDGKEISDSIKELCKLPFECISILGSQPLRPIRETREEIDTIAFAFTNEFNRKHRILNVDEITDGFYVIGALHPGSVGNHRVSGWIPECYAATCTFKPKEESGYTINGFIHPAFASEGVDPADEMRTTVADVMNLCVMLNLHNVKAIEQTIPPKLQKKRERAGKLPLYSYKVLEVAGDLWDRKESLGGDGAGFRSHMRRGHIRRLDETRKVWVRATMVHGKIPGFVDKEYQVSSGRVLNACQ